MSEHFGFDAEGPDEGFPGDGPHSWGADDPDSHDLGHDPLAEGLDGGADPDGHDPGLDGGADPFGFDHDPGAGQSELTDEGDVHGDLPDSGPGEDGFGHPSPDSHHDGVAAAIPENAGGHEVAAFGLDPDPSATDGDLSYPPPLDVDVVPTDGLDWVDPGLLGSETDAGPHFAVAHPDELLASVHSADGGDGEPTWEAMHASDDPATRALAAFWDPLSR
jgi:hypothetical protein